MDKKSELAKNTGIITIGKAATQSIRFFLLPLYTSILSTEEFGIVELCITYTSLLIPLVLFQAERGLFRFLVDVRDDEAKKRKLMSTVCLFVMFQIFAVSVIFFILQGFFHSEYKWDLYWNLISYMLSSLMLQVPRGLGDYVGYAWGSFISAVWQIAGNIIGLLVLKQGVHGMMAAAITSNLATAVFLFCWEKSWRYIRLKSFSKKLLKEILEYSIPLIPNELSWWAMNASDRTIVNVVLGTSFTGLLSVGHKFPTAFTSAYQIFNTSWTESASLHMEAQDNKEFFTDIINTMFRLFMSAAIGMIACMPFIFPVFVHSKFNGIYNAIPIFMLSAMCHVIVGLYTAIYLALKKTAEVAKTSIYSAIINVLSHIVLIRFIGIYAAAASTCIAFSSMALYRYVDIKKYINIKLESKAVASISVMLGISCIAYYSNNVIMQILALAAVAAGAILLNWQLLLGTWNKVMEKRSRMK